MGNNFYDILYDSHHFDLLKPVPYTELVFHNTEIVNQALLDIVKNDKKVLIYGDYDPDGLFCVRIAYEALKMFGCIKVSIYNYKYRTHDLDELAVMECIQSMPDYFIVCDTGSSDLDKIKLLLSYGIRVIVLDHHNTRFNYKDFNQVPIINTTLENQILGNTTYELSAGALTFCVFDTFAKSIGKNVKALSAYATVTLYSDCMNMTNPINRSIYYLAQSFNRNELPPKIQMFMHENSCFYSRFIQFRLVPKINSIFRTEKFEYINACFFADKINAAAVARCLESIETIYTSNREMVMSVSDTIDYVELNNFILADLKSVDDFFKIEENKLYNYTGLIANKLSDRCGKPAVVYCPMGNYYKGSFRDISGRNYLQIFKQFCNAGGHNAAFGIKIPYWEFESFLQNFKRLDENFPISELQNKPIILDYSQVHADPKLIRDISIYNEFAGQDVPLFYLRKVFSANMSGGKTRFYYLYNWDGCTLQSSFPLSVGDSMLLQPIRNNSLRAIVIKEL